MNTTEALLYARTLRHLRPVQLLGRARKAFAGSSVDSSPAPPQRVAPPLAAPADRAPVLTGPTDVVMLGVIGSLASAADWNDTGRSHLWRYHCHYFDDLRASGAADRTAWNDALIERWIAENEPGAAPAWDAYPTSLRIVNWVRWSRAHGLSEAAVQSLAEQARYLRAHIEWHLLGNHLFANAKALVFAGAMFEGDEAAEWLAKGLEILTDELDEQILADGGHFERSPMYHALILEDVLDLIALVQATPEAFGQPTQTEEWLGGLADHMGTWLAAMCHPDGEISLFNDAAIGQAPSPAALAAYAARLGRPPVEAPSPGVTFLEESGYVRLALGPAVAIVDVGEIGPDYLPGHAHADTLSFELSLDGTRLVVDSGTSLYEPGEERLRQRGTAAHNTVEVDGENSSEVWSSFRVARRARPRWLSVEGDMNGAIVRCTHDGYRRLRGKVTHERAWSLSASGMTIEDRLYGRFDSAVARLHLNPAVRVTRDEHEAALHAQGMRDIHVRTSGPAPAPRRGTWHPSFGASIANQHLVCAFPTDASTLRTDLDW